MRADELLIIDRLRTFETLSVNKPSGAIIVDGMHIADTLTCVHCGYTWIPIKGSGKIRGFCGKCHGVTCGRPECITCLPKEKRLDLYEKGKIRVL